MYQTTFKNNKYTIFHDYSENNTRAFDMSYGHIYIEPLENDEYTKFFQDIDTAVNVVEPSAIPVPDHIRFTFVFVYKTNDDVVGE